jgi:hypothetical protein
MPNVRGLMRRFRIPARDCGLPSSGFCADCSEFLDRRGTIDCINELIVPASAKARRLARRPTSKLLRAEIHVQAAASFASALAISLRAAAALVGISGCRLRNSSN